MSRVGRRLVASMLGVELVVQLVIPSLPISRVLAPLLGPVVAAATDTITLVSGNGAVGSRDAATPRRRCRPTAG